MTLNKFCPFSGLLLFVFSFIITSGDLAGQTSKREWVDSIFATMTLDQQIGQLFMMRAFSKDDQREHDKIIQLVEKYYIGGLCFFQGTPQRQAYLTNLYQSKSKIPLLISIDGEWGLGMRFPNDATSFPRQLTLGAIQDNSIIEEFGNEVATQLKRIGIHINFAPVVDVNSNAKNPVINDRSFGEDKYNVAAKSYHYTKGMQDYGLLACAKHFPGHGDTDVDSHFDLPIIKHSRIRLEDLELYPFRSLSDKGISSFMIGHLHIPAIDNRTNRPTTLSKLVVTDLLREDLGFDGLIFTDALEMRGVSKHFGGGLAEAEALAAGNDVLLLSENISLGIKKIKEYIYDGKISAFQLETSVRRILSAKYDVGLNDYKKVIESDIEQDVNSPQSEALKSRLIEKAITLVCDEKDLVPINETQDKKMATLSIGDTHRTAFQSRLNDYAVFDHYNTTHQISESAMAMIINNLKKYDKVVIGLHDLSKSISKNYGINAGVLRLIHEVSKSSDVILCVFGSPYALKNFEKIGTVVVSYEDDDLFRDVTAQSLFGANSITGKLPITASDKFYANLGIIRPYTDRLGYSIPERVGLNSTVLREIDQLAGALIADGSAPGCQVLVAKNGKIVWEKAYGYMTYDKTQPVTTNTVYDLASLTKILGTTVAFMRLQDQGKINTGNSVKSYLEETKGTNKGDLLMGDMLAHVAGLYPWIAFYDKTLVLDKKKTKLNPSLYSTTLRDSFSVAVATSLFLRDDYRDTIWQTIYDSELREARNYRYSDLGFYLTSHAVERVIGGSMDGYLYKEVYKSLGLKYMMYNPTSQIPLEQIAPSEIDNYWRNQVVRGTVHDMGAAMLGGVSGHAGLFSNARDVAVIMQMLLNSGRYGGQSIIRPETIRDFTIRHPRSTRRGFGFDLKELNPSRTMNMSEYASEWTFGHTGFTGTAVYADPVHDMVFVFLCNRTYPTMRNNKLHTKDYRPRIQSVLYKALMQGV